MAESSEEVSAAKRRRTFSEGEKVLLAKHQRHTKPAVEHLTESSDVKTDDVTESTKPEGKHVATDEQVVGRKDRKRKRTSVQSASEQDSELAARTAKAAKADNSTAEMRSEGVEAVGGADGAAKLHQESKRSLQCSAEDVKPSVKKQKQASKSKKEKKCKSKQKPELPLLRVISKLVAFSVHIV